MNKRKMIVTDLDGTLLKDDKSISKYTIDVIRRLRIEGHKFVIATGRPLRTVKEFMGNIDYDAAVCHNGALICVDGEEVSGFKIDNAKEVIDEILLRCPEASIAVEAEDALYANFDAGLIWPASISYMKKNFLELKSAYKIIVKVSSLEDMKRYGKLLPPELYIQLSEGIIGMIMNRGATKSNGIKSLAERYGIDTEDIISFGDDYNDIDMLEFCGLGICVENAVDDAKRSANQICGTNENDGVAKWIDDFLLSFHRS